jgi:hypothetical protein
MKLGSLTSIVAAFAVLLLLAGSANAQSTVPPGNGEADQYAETVPGAGGNETPDGTKDPNDVLPPGQVDDLENGGDDAAGVAAFTAATAPDDGAKSGGGDSNAAGQTGDGNGSSGVGDPAPVATASNPIPSQDDLGVWLWIIAGLAAAGAIGFGAGRWAQRRG